MTELIGTNTRFGFERALWLMPAAFAFHIGEEWFGGFPAYVIVLVGAPVQRARTGDHIAFRATPEILEATVAKLQTMGREFIRARSNRALYFFDYDDHVFELDTEDIDAELRG
jgi:hypothetical protein